jgi:hypothetical protein
MNPNKYPDLSFKLDDGRRVKVNAFVWEASYSETIEIQDGEDCRDLVRAGKRITVEKLFGHRCHHFIGPEYVDKYQNHPPRIPNTSITVLLSSTPIADGAISSELLLTCFMDHVEFSSIESMLQREVHDLDWEELAVDVSEEAYEVWDGTMFERSLH